MAASDLAQVIEQYHQALAAFLQGDPEPDKRLFSHRDDVTLANPLGPPVRGWTQVAAAMDRASSQLREGEQLAFERIAEYETAELAYLVQIERGRVKIGGATQPARSSLRTTTIFRREAGEWRIVHRHADPITSPRPPESVVEDPITPSAS
jgi:ketosteroid isomerase-like protein